MVEGSTFARLARDSGPCRTRVQGPQNGCRGGKPSGRGAHGTSTPIPLQAPNRSRTASLRVGSGCTGESRSFSYQASAIIELVAISNQVYFAINEYTH